MVSTVAFTLFLQAVNTISIAAANKMFFLLIVQLFMKNEDLIEAKEHFQTTVDTREAHESET